VRRAAAYRGGPAREKCRCDSLDAAGRGATPWRRVWPGPGR